MSDEGGITRSVVEEKGDVTADDDMRRVKVTILDTVEVECQMCGWTSDSVDLGIALERARTHVIREHPEHLAPGWNEGR